MVSAVEGGVWGGGWVKEWMLVGGMASGVGAVRGVPRTRRRGGCGAAEAARRVMLAGAQRVKNLPKFRHRPRVRPRSQRAGSGGAAMALVVAGRMRVLGACGARGRAHPVGEHQWQPSTPTNSILAPGAAPRRQPTARGVPETPPAMRRRGAEARWVRE